MYRMNKYSGEYWDIDCVTGAFLWIILRWMIECWMFKCWIMNECHCSRLTVLSMEIAGMFLHLRPCSGPASPLRLTCLRHRLRCLDFMEIAGIFLYPRPVLALHLRQMPASQAQILFCCLIPWRLRGFSFIPGLSWPCISASSHMPASQAPLSNCPNSIANPVSRGPLTLSNLPSLPSLPSHCLPIWGPGR